VTNPKEVENGEKPFLVQRGPYVYREVWEKRNVEFIGDQMLSYSPVTTLFFEPDLSNGKETDPITFLNVPATVNAFNKIKDKKLFLLTFYL
jgi:hypothetical protein